MKFDSTNNKSLGEKLREILQHGVIYGLGSVGQTVLGFILIPLYTKHLTPEMYGAWSLIVMCGTLAGTIFCLGISSALARSFYDYDSIEERKRTVMTSLCLTVVGAGLQILVGQLAKRPLSRIIFGTEIYAPHIGLALASTAFTFVNGLFYVVLRFQRRSRQVVVINLVALGSGSVLILYLLLVRQLGVLAPILGEFLNQIFLCALLAYSAREWIGGGFSKHELRVQLYYGLPIVLVGLEWYLLTLADRILLKHYRGLDDVGVYALGYRVGTLIYVALITPFCQIWTPARMEYRNKPGAEEFFKQVLTYFVLAGLLLAVTMSVFADETVHLIARSREYYGAENVIPWVACGYLLYGVENIVDSGIIFSRRIIYLVVVMGLAVVVNIFVNVLLIPLCGYVGAATSTFLSFGALLGGVYAISNHLVRIPVDGRRILTSVALAVLVFLLNSLLHGAAELRSAGLKIGLLIAFLLSVYWLVLNDSERAALVRIARRLGSSFMGRGVQMT